MYGPPKSDIRLVPSKIQFHYREDGDFVTKTSEDLFKGKRVVVFAIPGAFTPVCSEKHLPGFEKNYAQLKKAGKLDEIYCLSVHDAFVMDAWSKAGNAEEILMLSDGNCELANALGVTMDGSGIGLGTRSRRYSLVAEDGKITVLNLEQGGAFEVSSAEAILEVL